ncbi:TRAP transporter small permease [Zhihengliuella halotolerans]|uniref:TRAP transporter small permease n=1 Tax=Zhihengliuella halotolerans TaxID=370736 RepID=UPI000C806CD8|nr:TRAP transporter small permease [Zhihengliuella halotolerans]
MASQTRESGGALKRVVSSLTAVEIGIAAVLIAVIFLAVLVQSFQRYLPFSGLPWTGELSQFSLVWLTFVAAGVLVTRDGHIALQVVDNLKSERAVRAFHVLAHVIVAVIAILFAWQCVALIATSSILTSPSMGMNMSLHYVLPFVGFVSTAIRSVVASVVVARHGVEAAHESDALAIQVNREVQS